MSNKYRGEVALSIDGATYTLCFTVNALCSLEDVLDKSITEIIGGLSDINKLRLKTMRALLWAGLNVKHPEINIEAAGELIAKGSAVDVMTKVFEAIRLAFPQEAKGAEPNP